MGKSYDQAKTEAERIAAVRREFECLCWLGAAFESIDNYEAIVSACEAKRDAGDTRSRYAIAVETKDEFYLERLRSMKTETHTGVGG